MSLCVLTRGMHLSVHILTGCPQKLKAMQMLKPDTMHGNQNQICGGNTMATSKGQGEE